MMRTVVVVGAAVVGVLVGAGGGAGVCKGGDV
jgi:hypothetical protein